MSRLASVNKGLRSLVLVAAAVLFSGHARADIDLRVESWPNTGPIEAFVRVTDGAGSVRGLTGPDFAVTLDGTPLGTFTLGLPPDQDPAQRISVVFVLNNGSFAAAIGPAVKDFINQMATGGYASIVQTRYSIDPDLNIQFVQPFTQIDGGTMTNSLLDFVSVVNRSGWPRSFRSLMLAVEQFATPLVALPTGPKAIILIGAGRVDLSPESMSEVVAAVTEIGIPVFTVETGDNSFAPEATARMAALAAESGGIHFTAPDALSVAEAYATVSSLLNHAYRLAIPRTAVTDCNPHMLEITAEGQSANAVFTRCDSTPQDFHFPDRVGVVPGAIVVSDRVTITGIESPVPITVYGGQYSIGCGSTFTSAPGFIVPESEICVRHTASPEPGTASSTMLIVGGVSSSFWSSTSAAPPPPPSGGSGGGGGATGVLELLLALGALFARTQWSKE
jgi:hypothetical protein